MLLSNLKLDQTTLPVDEVTKAWDILVSHVTKVTDANVLSKAAVLFIRSYFKLEHAPNTIREVVLAVDKWNDIVVPILAEHEGISDRCRDSSMSMCKVIYNYISHILLLDANELSRGKKQVISTLRDSNYLTDGGLDLVCIYTN